MKREETSEAEPKQKGNNKKIKHDAHWAGRMTPAAKIASLLPPIIIIEVEAGTRRV